MVVIAIAAIAVIAVTTIIILFINFSPSLGSLIYCTGPPEARDVLPGCFEDLYKSITSSFPTIEQSGAGTQVGIGVASGADEIYVDPQRNAEIEDSCLLPLVASEDIQSGSIEWNSRYMLNPYDQNDDRQMLDLSMFPKVGAYLEKHAGRLKARYCAKKHPDSWYRTLDRISYKVLRAAKILLPDIQRGGNVALDERGEYYPHHNVYWITSDTWNMRALCVLMRSLIRDRPDSARVGSDAWWQHPLSGAEPAACPHPRVEQP